MFIRVDEINEAVQGGQKYGEEQHSTKHETSLDGLGWDCATRCVFSDPYRSYSLVRLGPFEAGARGLVLWLLAIVLGMMLSYLLFRGPRDAAARYLQERSEHHSARASSKRCGKGAQEDNAHEDGLAQ